MQMGDKVTWVEREEPRRVKFTTGTVVEGLLTGMKETQVKGSADSTFRYTVDLESGEQVDFLGTNQILKKIRLTDLGRMIHIECIGEDVTVQRGGNNMKVYKIFVSKEKFLTIPSSMGSLDSLPINTRNPEITDDDVGF
jgi:hypothetical protein